MDSLISSDPTRPYGTWPSAVTADLIASGSLRLGQVRASADAVLWVEVRASEQGRGVVMRWVPGGAPESVTPAGHSVRTRAHEYGGGDFCVAGDAVVYSNDEDQRLYRLAPGVEPEPITPSGSRHFADGVWDTNRRRVICVEEDHDGDEGEPVNRLVAVSVGGGSDPVVLAEGHDFYASPAVSPDGSHLCWLTWNHPDMPWNGTELWVAGLDDDGGLVETRRVAGGREESVFQPMWSPGGELHFVSDRTGWWNLYREREGGVEEVLVGAFETGLPQWVFGMSTYAFCGPDSAVVAVNELGVWHLVQVDLESGESRRLRFPYSDISQVVGLGEAVVCVAGSPREAPAIVWIDPARDQSRVVRRGNPITLDTDTVSFPQHIAFPVGDQVVSHGLYYAPTHPDWVGPKDEKPPLIVKSHGGPTAAASTALDLRIQFWTSRGFAVLDVNYRGSTGFGRLYRHALDGAWGLHDVEDCVAGAEFLVEQGRADERRLIITGSSAGGYTTLAALTFTDCFRAGASYYGVSDLEALVRDTHKFEARYLDRLVGAYPDDQETYRTRSPLHSAERITCPVIFFQGLLDKVVPPDQAEGLVEALASRGLPVAYVTFPDEGHGFRREDAIRTAIESELAFYARIFGLELPEVLDPVEIRNLPEADEDSDLAY